MHSRRLDDVDLSRGVAGLDRLPEGVGAGYGGFPNLGGPYWGPHSQGVLLCGGLYWGSRIFVNPIEVKVGFLSGRLGAGGWMCGKNKHK